MMIKQVPRLGNVTLWIGAQLGYVSQRVKKVPAAALRIGASQRRVAAFAEEARADLLDGNEVVLTYAAESRYKSLALLFVELRCLMDDHALGRLVAFEFLIAVDDEFHQSLSPFAGKMGRFALFPAEGVAAHQE